MMIEKELYHQIHTSLPIACVDLLLLGNNQIKDN